MLRILPFNWTVSAVPLYGLALVLPLSMALISIFKLASFLAGLVLLVLALANKRNYSLLSIPPVYFIVALLSLMALTLPFSSAEPAEAIHALAKYGKLLLIPLALVLIRTRKQALNALFFYVALQSFVVLSSWLLFFGFKLPYVPVARNHFTVVFSSSLDQAILTAGFVVLCWHLAKEFPGKYGQQVAWFLAAFGTLNIVFVLYGRTGQICLLAAISLTAFWALSKKMRIAVVVLPFVLLYGASAVSPQFKQGISSVKNEVQEYQKNKGEVQLTSSGLRMEFWNRSLELFEKEPLIGYGLGSWKHQYDLVQKNNPLKPKFDVGNPHQEFLLIGVQLGMLGLALFIGWIVSMAWHVRQYDITSARTTQCFLAVFVVASMFNSALYDGLVGDYFCTILGLLLAVGAHAPNTAAQADSTNTAH
jgi:O-antigen ligase